MKDINKQQELQELRNLTEAPGAPGFEEAVNDLIRIRLKGKVNIEEDSTRNLYLRHRKNRGDRPLLMLDGHSDEVAFMVQAVLANGTLTLVPLGGMLPEKMAAQELAVRTRQGNYLPGIVTSTPPHFLSAADKEKKLGWDSLKLDIGAVSAADALSLGIEIGAPAVPVSPFRFLEPQGIIKAKALDNRLGCSAVAAVMELLAEEELNIDLVGVISAQEEVGHRGAQISARRIKPDAALVLEGTPADDNFRDSAAAQSVLKRGPQIRFRDASMIANPRFVAYARSLAEEAGLPFQTAVRAGGGTDGGAIHLTAAGVPTVVLGVPVRYVHTPHGLAAWDDFAGLIRWTAAIASDLTEKRIKSW